MNTGINRDLPLTGREISLDSCGVSAQYSTGLLRSLGANITTNVLTTDEFSCAEIASDWASSGLAFLTGYPDSPGQGPAAIPSAARGALDALKLLAGPGSLEEMNGAALLCERAGFLHLGRQGQTSANGSCRLLQASDGWLALNLARDDDWALMPAWLGPPLHNISWETLAERVAVQSVSLLLERGRLMGLPVALVSRRPDNCEPWFTVASRVGVEKNTGRSESSQPLVVDLSSLWAGPLCSHLLQQTGARVIKVESETRPDGARRGNADFFELLNTGKESVVLDFSSDKGIAQLRSLLEKADIVVEGSRPRALQQLGINPQQLLKSAPGLTWVGITGYGREEPAANWVAFGDDASAAAGVAMATADPPIFCGDALADPLTGIHSALAALAFWQGGGGVLLDLSLHKVTAQCLGFHANCNRGVVVKGQQKGEWRLEIAEQSFVVKPPRPRPLISQAVELGGDTARVLREFHIPC
ncbi:MAG: CoA transferase [Proteobacteria bacterium]|nr:CoA transferase [Pseudomonadota bacterium]